MKGRQARTFAGTVRNIAFLAGQLRAGELVAVPTETVYGLAANALDRRACAKIFRAKGRPSQDPLIVHIHSFAELNRLCESNEAAVSLAKAFWPGALTLVLPKKKCVPDVVTSGRDSVAIRMPAHRLFRRLIKRAGIPLAAPSANPFGYISPTSAKHVREGLGTKIRYILDGGTSRIGLESTIVDLRDPKRPAILRPGAVAAADLERVLGLRVAVAKHPTPAKPSRLGNVAPGLLARHYSPRTPLTLHHRLTPATRARLIPTEAFVYVRRPAGRLAPNIFWLDPQGKLSGAARGLFALLRKLDAMNFECIHVERAPNRGVGLAINDRLARAAAR